MQGTRKQGQFREGERSVPDQSERRLAVIATHVAAHPLFTEQQLIDILRSSPVATAITRCSDSRVMDANAAFVDLIGYSYDELIGHTTTELGLWQHPEQRGTILEALSRDGRLSNFELEWRRKSGETVVILGTIAQYQSADETYLVSMVLDVTERHRIAEALERSQRTFQLALASMDDAVFISDRDGRFIEFNDAFATFHKFGSKSDCAKTVDEYPSFLEVRTPSGRLVPLEHWAVPRALRGERARNVEYHLRRKDTGESWVGSYSFGPIHDGSGAIVGSVVVARDVTTSRAAEQALRDSEERFRSLVDASPDAIFIQTGGNFAFVNPATIQLFGAARAEDLIGKPVLPRFHQEYQEQVKTRIRRLNIDRAAQPALDLACVTLSGERKEVNTCAVPFRFNGQDGALVFARDITARKRAESAREEARTQLLHSQKMESVGRLAGGVAHDFNNLLSVILSYADFVLEEVAEDSPIREDLLEIQRSGERARLLTRQLLAFSRRQVLQPKILNVNEVVEGVTRMLSSTIGEDIALKTVLASQVDPIEIDCGQLEQILLNLATNARDAMPEGGELIIETSTLNLAAQELATWPSLPAGRYVMLSVKDSGCGIPDSMRSRIFEPFFTTKPPGKGTGLGLSTVYGIVEQNRGGIAIESRPNQGTCMKILLPAVQGAAVDERPSRLVRPKTTGHQTVLVVEDSDSIQRMIKRVLSSAGYVVLRALTPELALRLCSEHAGPIALLLTDVVMPEMNGHELAQRVSALRSEIKVLFMSGYADDTIGNHGILKPGTSFIAKPFGAAELRDKVHEVLQS